MIVILIDLQSIALTTQPLFLTKLLKNKNNIKKRQAYKQNS